jgi:hypothetical protein
MAGRNPIEIPENDIYCCDLKEKKLAANLL